MTFFKKMSREISREDYELVKSKLLALWDQTNIWDEDIRQLSQNDMICVYNLMNPILNAKSTTFPSRGKESQKVYDLAFYGWKYFSKISKIQARYPTIANVVHDEVHHGIFTKIN